MRICGKRSRSDGRECVLLLDSVPTLLGKKGEEGWREGGRERGKSKGMSEFDLVSSLQGIENLQKPCCFAPGPFLGGLALITTACICRKDNVGQSLFPLADATVIRRTQQKVPRGSLWRILVCLLVECVTYDGSLSCSLTSILPGE